MVDLATFALTREWLQKADEDLRAAKLLAVGCLFAPTLFHCQQAIEKGLKATLCFHQVVVPKTHDLSYLCELAADIDPFWNEYKSVAEEFTSYGVEMRYPGAGSVATGSVASQLQATEAFLQVIFQRLPAQFVEGSVPDAT